jgi:hypothetical protein
MKVLKLQIGYLHKVNYILWIRVLIYTAELAVQIPIATADGLAVLYHSQNFEDLVSGAAS